MAIFGRSKASGDTFDPTFRYETSWLLPPSVLFAIRAFLSLYAFVTIFFIFGWNGTHGLSEDSEHSFSFFTNLTYWGLAFYFLFSAVHTCSYWLTTRPLVNEWPRTLQVAHGMFYSTITVFPWIVTIVFWALLFSGRFPSQYSSWTNTSQHALNSAYALFEIILPRTPPLPFLHLITTILLLALYLALAYLTHTTEGFYVYSFLDIHKNGSGKTAAYIIGILVADIVVFLIVRYLIVLRVWVTERKLGKLGNFTSRGRQEISGDSEAQKCIELQNISGK
ncbi:hypothetical protein BDV96DRAFT_563551 [Lophiotrema nucula]|uniref:FAR-17a/AIG1-like protein n=1 Tax=Lophiotrema nucula TaxID=690887 RepID=A0A6A5ZQ20_9PLEO|nr:hypothetical protein BDV96DRAFT_563551 [Lophiotrema nucula]